MGKQDIKLALDELFTNPKLVTVYTNKLILKGSVFKSRDKYYVMSSESLFRLVPADISRIENIEGEKIWSR